MEVCSYGFWGGKDSWTRSSGKWLLESSTSCYFWGFVSLTKDMNRHTQIVTKEERAHQSTMAPLNVGVRPVLEKGQRLNRAGQESCEIL